MNALVECIPNFSEGRRPEIINAIVGAITAAAPVRLLDTSSDADHNRTVVTFVGAPEAVEKAAFAGIQTAAQLIDMDQHRGEHPRMGATDVAPFVPIRGATMDDCVAIAKRLGERVGRELNIPVYLYSAAASRPEREDLPNIRRGEYEGIKDAIRTDPERRPDYGPSELGKAGATAIGARPALIAFNVYLATENVEIAKKIAKAVRFSSGGLRYIQASGFLVDGRAQVSMNLTNFEKTPIYRVVEMVRREAERYGVNIAYSELVGLIPEDALIDAARWYLQLDLFQPDQVLERRLQIIPEPTPTMGTSDPSPNSERGEGGEVSGFVSQVAAGTPAPGGGAVAALAGALAAALAEMVANLTKGKRKYADVEREMLIILAESQRAALLRAIDEDIAAYSRVMEAYKLSKDDPARAGRIQNALLEAAKTPLSVMALTVDVMRQCLLRAARFGNVNAVTDAGTGVLMATAAVESAALNVRTNLKGLADLNEARQLSGEMKALLDQAHSLGSEILAIVEERAGLQ